MSTIMAFAVEKTVTLPDGQVIDWMRREAQGEIASPPAPPQHDKRLRKLSLSAFNSTSQSADSHGSSAALSTFAAYVANEHDFSLLQTAMARLSVPGIGIQTRRGRVDQLASTAGGCSTTPRTTRGMPLASLLVVGGDLQRNLQLQYKLEAGNWWLAVNGRLAGIMQTRVMGRRRIFAIFSSRARTTTTATNGSQGVVGG